MPCLWECKIIVFKFITTWLYIWLVKCFLLCCCMESRQYWLYYAGSAIISERYTVWHSYWTPEDKEQEEEISRRSTFCIFSQRTNTLLTPVLEWRLVSKINKVYFCRSTGILVRLQNVFFLPFLVYLMDWYKCWNMSQISAADVIFIILY